MTIMFKSNESIVLTSKVSNAIKSLMTIYITNYQVWQNEHFMEGWQIYLPLLMEIH